MVRIKAAVIEKIGVFSIKDVEEAKLTSNTLKIKIESCAICGSDLRIFKKGDQITFDITVRNNIPIAVDYKLNFYVRLGSNIRQPIPSRR